MESNPKPLRWRRSEEQRRATVRRMLAGGALVGLGIGLVAQFWLPGVEAEIRPVVRVLFLIPALMFVLWWMLLPGLSLEDGLAPMRQNSTIDAGERVAQIESTFDRAAVPSAGRRPLDATDAGFQTLIRGSLRRGSLEGTDAEQYRTRRSSSSDDIVSDSHG